MIVFANVQKGWECIVGRGSMLLSVICCCCCLLYVLQACLSQSTFWTSSKRGRLLVGGVNSSMNEAWFWWCLLD